ncbi:MAG TPA: hypothetical protein VK787_02165, partial [Puia sp.]|nr:hypothetical protein [Puia sp.]
MRISPLSLVDERDEIRKKIIPKMTNRFPSLSGPLNDDSFAHMFKEDAHLGIMPYMSYTSGTGQKVKCVFKGAESEIRKAMDLISDFCNYDRNDQTGLICDAINQIAQELSWEGKIFYEIFNFLDNGESHLFARYFTHQRVFRVPFLGYVQFVPKKDQEYLKAKYFHCNKKDVFEITIPKELGGLKRYKNIVASLNKYSHLGPNFFRDNIEAELNNKDYDFSNYRRNQIIFVFSITKNLG